MINNSGLLNDYWRQYRQKRINTGIGMTQNEVLGAVDAGLAHERQMAQISGQQSLQREQLQMQKDAMDNQNRAAAVSGIANIAGMAGNMYLGKGMLDIYRAKTLPGTAGAGAANGGIVTGGSGIPMANAGATPSAMPYSSTGIAGNMGEGLNISAPSATSGAWAAPLQTAGVAAGGVMALNEGGKYVADKTGMPRSISTALAPIIGPTMKVAELGKDLLDSIF